MSNAKRHLPEFERPPVSEVAISMAFSPIEGWGIPHFGLFWQSIRAEYPRFEVHGPVRIEDEKYGPLSSQAIPSMPTIVVAEPTVRCWFMNDKGSSLVQIQRDRFSRNWRKMADDEVYPRYKSLRPSFASDWTRYKQFLNENQLKEPRVSQCEITYINDIVRGEDWRDFSEFKNIIAPWSGAATDGFLPTPESALFGLAYVLPESKGRLRAVMQHAIRARDGEEILQLNLSVRGKPASDTTDDLLAWLDLGHEWIVRGFADLTAGPSQEAWGRIRT